MRLQCWKCASPLKDIILPFSKYEECGACKADQHACRIEEDSAGEIPATNTQTTAQTEAKRDMAELKRLLGDQ